MKKIVFILTLILLLSINSAYSFQIDDDEEKCLKAATDYRGMIKCVKTAQSSWQKEIDKNFSKLKDLMKENDYINMKQSQKEWEQFKKSEFDSIEKVIRSKNNSADTIFLYEGFKTDILKQRAITLFGYTQIALDSKEQ